MKYVMILFLLFYACSERETDNTTATLSERTILQQGPLQKHSHFTLAQQAHQDPQKSAALRKQIALQKKERRQAYQKNMEQRKKQLERIAVTKE